MKYTMKKITSSMLVTTMLASSIPVNVFANEVDHLSVLDSEQQMDKNMFGSSDLFSAMDKTAAITLVMDVSALILLKKKAIDLGDSGLVDYQEKIKKYADEWFNDPKLKDQLFQTSADIQGYNDRIQSFYNILKQYAQQNDWNNVLFGLNQLQKDAKKYQEHVNQVIKELNQFKNKITPNIKVFSKKADEKIDFFSKADLQDYNDQMKDMQQDLQNDLSKYATGAADKLWIAGIVGSVSVLVAGIIQVPVMFQTALAPLMGEEVLVSDSVLYNNYFKSIFIKPTLFLLSNVLGNPLMFPSIIGIIVSAVHQGDSGIGEKFDDHIQALKEQTEWLSKEQQEAVALKLFKDQADTFANMIDDEIDSVQQMSEQWEQVDNQLSNLMNQVNDEDTDSLEFISNLDHAQEEWKYISDFADVMYIHGYKEEII